jgi:thiopeptide-type bacteriocin biosynthesis protein
MKNSINNVRTHLLGSNWIYLKVYAHQEIVDKIILNDLFDIYNKKLKNIAINFYFIRFFDPEFHLRIRIEIYNHKDILNVVTIFYKYLNKLVYKQFVLKVEYSTYEREIERYGFKTISSVERLFTIDSVRILNLLKVLKEFDIDERYRSLMAFQVIDNTMNSFDISNERRIEILKNLSNNYFDKMQITNKRDLKIIKDRYRNERNFFMKIYDHTVVEFRILNAKNSMDILNPEYNTIISNIRTEIPKLDRIEVLATDLIHMSMNRLFTSDNNLIEAILYFYASKNYATMLNLNLKRNN